MSEGDEPIAPPAVDVPGEDSPRRVKRVRDKWDKIQIFMQPLGGLFTGIAIAILGFKSSDYLNRRQAVETNTRLYSEIMSKREESESALRKDMFQTIIGSFVNASGKGDLDSSVLNLELLAYNFHESLNLKPLFLDLKRRIARQSAGARSPADKDEYADYLDRLERVAREIARKQVIVLEGVGKKVDRSIDLSGDPTGESLEPATLVLDSLQATIGIDILAVDKANKELQVGLSVEIPDPKLGRQTKTATFTVSYYDFPMIDNTRLSGSERSAVSLTALNPNVVSITLAYFPASRASLKDKPYYDEVIRDLVRDRGPRN